ncbi:MAG: lipopolysaccharide biosynthesis protein [Parapedobacter sp.]|nr:MAG: lipopolysaccharide biosynthesis protein [Parapedobacter sp.]
MAGLMRYVSGIFKNKYVLSLLSNGSSAVIGMLTLTLLFRHLSLNDMGEYSFFLTVLLFFDTFRSGFLSTAFINFYAGEESVKKDKIAGAAWVIAICITSIFLLVNGIAYLFADRVEDSSIRLFLRYFGVIYLFSLPFFMANCVLQARQQFDRLLALNLTNQGSLMVFIIVTILIGELTVVHVIYCYMASNLLSSGIAIVCRWTLIGKIRLASKSYIRELFNFGKYSVGTSITATLMNLSGTFIIKFLLGTATLAVYNAGSKLIQIVELPLRSVVFAAMPTMSEAYNQGDRVGVLRMTQKYIGLFSFALLPVCVATIFFANYAILLLAGEKYLSTEAPNLLRIYMIIMLLYPAERFLALTIDVFRLPKINFIKVVIMVAAGVLTCFVAVYITKSIYAATLSSAVSIVIGLVFGFIALARNRLPIPLVGILQVSSFEIQRLLKIARYRR